MSHSKYTIFSIAFLFFLSALMMFKQIVSAGYFSCIIEDSYTYTSWAGQFIQALKEGIIYPRWLPLNFWGYGSPTFIIYPPLAFYLVGLFNVFTGSVITAMNLSKFAALFLSGMGMFFLVKEFYSEKIALLTAAFYVIFPYNIFQFYFIGTFASTISFMWFSPIILFTYRYIKQGSYTNMAYAGLCYGGLILTHLINAYMFTFVFIAFIIYMSIIQKRPEKLLAIPMILVIGFLISAAYTLPIMYEKGLVSIKAFLSRGFHFANCFILPNRVSTLPADRFWPVYYDFFIFFVLLFFIFIFLFLILILKMNSLGNMEDVNAVNKFFAATAICSMFLLFGISTFIWKTIPFFNYIQFPHRWLNITTFAIGFLSSSAFWNLRDTYNTKREHRFFLILLLLVCLLSVYCLLLDYGYIKSAHFFKENELMPVRAANWNIEHLPAGVDMDKVDNDNQLEEKAVATGAEGSVRVTTWKSTVRIAEMTLEKPSLLRIRTFNTSISALME